MATKGIPGLLRPLLLGPAISLAIIAGATRADPAVAPDLALGVPTGAMPAWSELAPLDVHTRTSLTIVEQLRHSHYLSKDLDDDASSQVFEKYLELLDASRVYFLASDVAGFEKYRYTLDDALKRGDLAPAFEIFNCYQERLIGRFEYLLKELDKGLDRYDFTIDESVEIDRTNAAWPANITELDELWRKRLKAAALTMKLNDKPVPEIQELLSKRYANRLKQTQQAKSEDAFQLYVNAFASTYDPHTQYFSPRTSQNFNINMSVSLEGIGAVLRSEDEYTSVVRLVPAGPADKSGQVQPADRITGVGQGDTGPLIDVVGWRLDDVVELIRGPKGSIVRLEISSPEAEDDAIRIVPIERNTVQLEEQAAQKKLLTLNRGGDTYRIGIVEVPTFYVDFKAVQKGDPNYKSTTRDVRILIDELKAEGIDALVVDLRNNGGGSLQEADSLTGLFIESGPTVQVKSARRKPSIYADTDESVSWDGPLAVMVNRLSASASEIFAGAIQDYERGLIIGSQTFGKGTVQTLVPLNRGQLKITAAKFYRVSGQSTQHQGVIPDVAFPELYDVDRIGESSLDDALPWDVITPAIYPRSSAVHNVLSDLTRLHDKRVAGDPDFVYMRALSDKTRENSKKTTISLSEPHRIAEKASDDAWRLGLENALRKAKGEPLLASLDDLEETTLDEDGAELPQEPEVVPAADDPMVVETGQVLIDFITLSRQFAAVEGVDTPLTVVQ
jgi:carboxyl-terminal processing protease